MKRHPPKNAPTTMVRPDIDVGTVTVAYDVLSGQMPEKSYWARTMAAEYENGICSFTFAQLRPRVKTIQSAVNVEMPIAYIKASNTGFATEFRSNLKRLTALTGAMQKYPSEISDKEYPSISYRSIFVKLMSNEVGATIDFYDVPLINNMTKSKMIDVIRIICTPAVVSCFVEYCDQFSNEAVL